MICPDYIYVYYNGPGFPEVQGRPFSDEDIELSYIQRLPRYAYRFYRYEECDSFQVPFCLGVWVSAWVRPPLEQFASRQHPTSKLPYYHWQWIKNCVQKEKEIYGNRAIDPIMCHTRFRPIMKKDKVVAWLVKKAPFDFLSLAGEEMRVIPYNKIPDVGIKISTSCGSKKVHRESGWDLVIPPWAHIQ